MFQGFYLLPLSSLLSSVVLLPERTIKHCQQTHKTKTLLALEMLFCYCVTWSQILIALSDHRPAEQLTCSLAIKYGKRPAAELTLALRHNAFWKGITQQCKTICKITNNCRAFPVVRQMQNQSVFAKIKLYWILIHILTHKIWSL